MFALLRQGGSCVQVAAIRALQRLRETQEQSAARGDALATSLAATYAIFVDMLKSDEEAVRQAAATALNSTSTQMAKSHLPELLDRTHAAAFNANDKFTRRYIALTLTARMHGSAVVQFIPSVAPFLEDPCEEVRETAGQVLNNLYGFSRLMTEEHIAVFAEFLARGEVFNTTDEPAETVTADAATGADAAAAAPSSASSGAPSADGEPPQSASPKRESCGEAPATGEAAAPVKPAAVEVADESAAAGRQPPAHVKAVKQALLMFRHSFSAEVRKRHVRLIIRKLESDDAEVRAMAVGCLHCLEATDFTQVRTRAPPPCHRR